MIAPDTINNNTLWIPTFPAPSVYSRKYIPTISIPKYNLNKTSHLMTKLISEESDKPCYKTSINNIDTFLEHNNIYKNSERKSLIMENINNLICEYGKSKEESIQNMKEKIKYNVEMHKSIKKDKKEIDKMSQIFFEIIDKIDNELS